MIFKKKSTSSGLNVIILSSSRIITSVLLLITTMVLSRYRSLSEYGTYSQLLACVTLFSEIFLMGIHNSINYFIGKEDDKTERKRYFSNYISLVIILCFLTGGILFLAKPIIIAYYQNQYIKDFGYFLLFYPLIRYIILYSDNVLVVYNKTQALVLLKISHSLTSLSIALIAALVNISFFYYVLILLCSEALFSIITMIYIYNLVGGFKFSFDKKIIYLILSYSIPLGLSSILGTINTELDKLVIGKFFSTDQYAIYSNAAKELPFTFLSGAIITILLPIIVREIGNEKYKNAIERWSSSIIVSYSVLVFIAFGLIAFAEDALTFLYSDKYLSGANIFRIYCLILPLRCTYFGMILNATGKTKFILLSSILSLIMNVVLNILFFYMFGFAGPAVATVVATLFVQLWQLYMTTKVVKIPFTRIFPWKKFAILTIVGIIFSSCMYIIKEICPLEKLLNSLLESVIIALGMFIIYALTLFKFIKKEWSVMTE